ncbi:GlxA family transcriptional regulator [Hyphomonas sp.]|uniref:GlxA family transcriptional regulator n=1 Tax=Hyphomonas sp. TaxID=87 RepID=UPI003F705A71
MKAHPEPTVALLVLPESTPASIYGLYEVFEAVGHQWESLTGEAAAGGRMRPRIVARDGLPPASSYGLPIMPQEGLGPADIVIIADLAFAAEFDPHGHWPVEMAWLRARYAAGAVICSVCTGTLALAEAGLLDGETATTHWAASDLIAAHYPAIHLAPQRILTASGDGDRILTAGGTSAWADLALYLIARFSSGTEAVRAAKMFLLGDHSDGQLPFAGARKAHKHDDAIVAAAQTWIADNYHSANPVSAMTAHSGLAPRTFLRRFKAATNYTPTEYIQTLRIEEAKQLLETGTLPVETIGLEVGYEDPNFFRRLFKRMTGITPARYRQRFSRISKAATVG